MSIQLHIKEIENKEMKFYIKEMRIGYVTNAVKPGSRFGGEFLKEIR